MTWLAVAHSERKRTDPQTSPSCEDFAAIEGFRLQCGKETFLPFVHVPSEENSRENSRENGYPKRAHLWGTALPDSGETGRRSISSSSIQAMEAAVQFLAGIRSHQEMAVPSDFSPLRCVRIERIIHFHQVRPNPHLRSEGRGNQIYFPRSLLAFPRRIMNWEARH